MEGHSIERPEVTRRARVASPSTAVAVGVVNRAVQPTHASVWIKP